MSVNSNVDSILDSLLSDTLVSGLTLTQSATFTKRIPGAYTPLTGAQAVTDTTSTVNVLTSSYSATEVYHSNGAILNTDRKFLLRPVSGVDITDLSDDTVTVDSRVYNIMSASQQSMGSTDLIWEVQCR